jgi:RNA polymerase sigma-70 factor (ECF subfamily)
MTDRGQEGGEELRLYLLVLRCQAGDERAFDQLFRLFGGKSLGYLRGLVGDAADDVQQEVWVAVYRGISKLSNPRAFRTWLFSTTRHRAIDFLRKRKRERELVADAALEAAAVEPANESDDLALDSSIVAAALGALPAAHREVLVLRYMNDLSYAEIAVIAGCSIGTIRSRLHHAKRRLHEIVNQKSTTLT